MKVPAIELPNRPTPEDLAAKIAQTRSNFASLPLNPWRPGPLYAAVTVPHARLSGPVRLDNMWQELLSRLRARHQSTPRRILIVDPDDESARLFRRQASVRGAGVDRARDDIEAFSVCVEYTYDLVVLAKSGGLADKLFGTVRALQNNAAIVLLRDVHESFDGVIAHDDPGISGILTRPWTETALKGLVERSFALADSRLEWNSSLRASFPLTVHVLYVGSADELNFVAPHLERTPNGCPIVVHHAPSLAAARLMLESQTVDAVVASLSLPDARGLDAVVQFSEGPSAIPVISLAPHRDEPLVAQLLRHGAHDFLTYSAVHAGRLEEALSNALNRHRATQRVTHLAHHDSLTGLPNRLTFEQQLHASLSRASRKDQHLAVLYIDLDGFKPINDRYGHDAGDRVLKAMAKRIQASVRDYDTPARLGGDEFAIVLDAIAHPNEAHSVAERLQAALEEPVDIGGMLVPVGSSIGVAVYPEAGATSESLVRAADIAMFRAKRRRRPGRSTSKRPLRLVERNELPRAGSGAVSTVVSGAVPGAVSGSAPRPARSHANGPS
jgi:diguanylate cyclase (GGDEF)-like protein